MRNCIRKQTAFTLVEMLVVISVIALLVGLLFPAIGSAIRNAKRTKAKAEVTHLVTAFKAYYTEFGVWPTNLVQSIQMSTGTLVNARGIAFYDFSPNDVDMSTGFYLDPWRRPYWYRVDHDYNNSIASPFSGDGNVGQGVLIWSEGPGKANFSARKSDLSNREVVTSW
jgi:prepilin-type N-terminal cleavage/methylation domain-containing protein